MKKSLKYGLLMIFLCLLHSIIMKAANADIICSTIGFEQRECSIAQAHLATHGAFEFFQICYSNMPCEMGHTDLSHVPTAKSDSRLSARLRNHKLSSRPLSYNSPQCSLHNQSDPVSYYVFGLRKIII